MDCCSFPNSGGWCGTGLAVRGVDKSNAIMLHQSSNIMQTKTWGLTLPSKKNNLSVLQKNQKCMLF